MELNFILKFFFTVLGIYLITAFQYKVWKQYKREIYFSTLNIFFQTKKFFMRNKIAAASAT